MLSLPKFILLLLALLPTVPLSAQLASDTRRVQFAYTVRYGEAIGGGPNFELPQTGNRETVAFFLDQELELRFSKNWSALAIIGLSNARSWRDPRPQSNPFVEDPEFVNHPFTSSITSGYFQLGAQYSYRIGSGDLSFAITGGIARNSYLRDYDQILGSNGNYSPGGTLRDETRGVSFWTGTARLQYTYWFGRSLALGLGSQYQVYSYLSGGIDTPGGLRYELRNQQSTRLAVPFNVNYDITSFTPDPTTNINRFSWFISLTSRFGS